MCVGRSKDDAKTGQKDDDMKKISGEIFKTYSPSESGATASVVSLTGSRGSPTLDRWQGERPGALGMNAHTQGAYLNPSLDQVRSMPARIGSAGVSGAQDDRAFQLLLEHHKSPANSSIPKESLVKLILNQKESIQQRQLRLTEELKTLQLKNSLLDNMLAKEATDADLVRSIPAPARGSFGDYGSLSAFGPRPFMDELPFGGSLGHYRSMHTSSGVHSLPESIAGLSSEQMSMQRLRDRWM